MIESNKIQQLDLNLLKVFECLYQERNMTNAAKLLFISPSAVSHAVKRLRVALKDDLFVRQGQEMHPTPVCQRIAPQLIESLSKLRLLLQTCDEFSLSQTRQVFRIAMHDALEAIVLPKMHNKLFAEAPKSSLESVKLSRREMVRHLTIGQADAAIDIALPIKAPINHLELSRDKFCVLMDYRHQHANNLTADHYLSQKHIAVSTRVMGNVLEDYAFLEQGINRRIDIRCQNYLTAKQMLKNSSRLLTLPNMIAEQFADNHTIIQELPFELPPVTTSLYWHQNTDNDEALVWLRHIIKQSFEASS